jgi:potassium-transporting ATPase KdpC subunit
MTRPGDTALWAGLRPQFAVGLRMLVVLTVLTGLAYPLLVTGVAQALFPGRANGSLIEHDGTVVGSSLIGQSFTGDGAFQPRPSAAGDGYDGASSGASNLGPTNPDLLAEVEARAAAYRRANGLPATAAVPVDAVTASGSGLDPQISVANARLQAPRVARARGLPLPEVLGLIDRHTQGRVLGVLGEPGVNVLELNLALDDLAGGAR